MNDDELKQRFRELRARDARHAPSFEKLTAKRPRRVSPLFVVTPVFAAAAALLLYCGTTTTAKRAPASAVAYEPPPPPSVHAQAPAPLPLDFLLETSPISVHLDSEGLLP